MKIRSGGGITSNKLVQDRKYKQEPTTHRVNIPSAAQQGISTQFPKRPLTQGKGYEPQKMGSTGVPGKYNAATSGPGSLRTVHPSGSQSQYGPVAQGSRNTSPDVPATSTRGTRDILSGYGPERRR